MAETDLLILDHVRHRDAEIALIILNRPEARNPLDAQTVRELRALLSGLAQQATCDAVVLTGAGEAFSAGGDLKGYQSLYGDPEGFNVYMQDFAEVCRLLERSLPLAVAMINGVCVAGGLELSLACDLITIADSARVGDGHLRFAELPGAGGSQRLVRALGVQRAKNWLLTGALFSSEIAVTSGLATLAAPSEQLREATFDLVARVTSHSRLALLTMKELVATASSTPLEEGLAIERARVLDYATRSYDAVEGLRAFAERRPPRYEGR